MQKLSYMLEIRVYLKDKDPMDMEYIPCQFEVYRPMKDIFLVGMLNMLHIDHSL